jgi:hypothetical protein
VYSACRLDVCFGNGDASVSTARAVTTTLTASFRYAWPFTNQCRNCTFWSNGVCNGTEVGCVCDGGFTGSDCTEECGNPSVFCKPGQGTLCELSCSCPASHVLRLCEPWVRQAMRGKL